MPAPNHILQANQRTLPAPRRAFWRWALVLAFLAAGASATSIAFFFPPRRVPVQVVRAARSDLVVQVLCAGTLQPPPGGELRAPESGTVAAILVTEAERVHKGSPLLRLDNQELIARALEAREEAERLRGERSVGQADFEREAPEAAHRRQVVDADTRLLAAGAIPRSTYDADELALRQAEARLEAVRARLRSIDGSAGGRSRLLLAIAKARDLEARVQALTVRARSDGTVYGLPRREGEAVVAGQVVANVADRDHPRVRLRVDQPDLPRVAAGQRLVATFDGLPEREWEGKVESVAPGLREASGREVGEVLGALADPAHALPLNASVNVKVVVGERRSALSIPRAALHRDGNRRFVYVDREGRAARREVRVGLVGMTEVEVEDGLAEGDLVVLPGLAPLADGTSLAGGAPRP